MSCCGWLDAHSSGPHTADAGDVLPRELEIITSSFPKALIVIDDQISAESIDHLVPKGWKSEWRTGEVIVYKEGQYKIPAFEE